MIEYVSLFDLSTNKELEIGSKEWRIKRYHELIEYSFEELEKYQDEIFDRYHIKENWDSEYDYYSSLVMIDIFHYHYFEEFVKKYPKSYVYKQKPFYL